MVPQDWLTGCQLNDRDLSALAHSKRSLRRDWARLNFSALWLPRLPRRDPDPSAPFRRRPTDSLLAMPACKQAAMLEWVAAAEGTYASMQPCTKVAQG